MDAVHSNEVVSFFSRNHHLKRHLPGVYVSAGNAALCNIVIRVAAFEPELAIIIGLSIMAFDSFRKETKCINEMHGSAM